VFQADGTRSSLCVLVMPFILKIVFKLIIIGDYSSMHVYIYGGTKMHLGAFHASGAQTLLRNPRTHRVARAYAARGEPNQQGLRTPPPTRESHRRPRALMRTPHTQRTPRGPHRRPRAPCTPPTPACRQHVALPFPWINFRFGPLREPIAFLTLRVLSHLIEVWTRDIKLKKFNTFDVMTHSVKSRVSSVLRLTVTTLRVQQHNLFVRIQMKFVQAND
jgi:hypothetical protein